MAIRNKNHWLPSLDHETLHSLAYLEDHIHRGFECIQTTMTIFFDIQKAYDTMLRYLILKTLQKNYIHGHLTIFIANFDRPSLSSMN